VAAKLTDKTRKRIITDRANGMTERQIAAKYGVSQTTVHNTLKNDPTTVQIVSEKKEANTMDMLAFMDSQKGKAQQLIQHIIEALDDPEKLARTNPRDLATALGIIADKFLDNTPKAAQAVQDDGFLKALKGTAADDWKDHGEGKQE